MSLVAAVFLELFHNDSCLFFSHVRFLKISYFTKKVPISPVDFPVVPQRRTLLCVWSFTNHKPHLVLKVEKRRCIIRCDFLFTWTWQSHVQSYNVFNVFCFVPYHLGPCREQFVSRIPRMSFIFPWCIFHFGMFSFPVVLFLDFFFYSQFKII